MLYTEVGFGIFWFTLLNAPYYQWVVTKILSITAVLFWLVELWLRRLAIIQDPELDDRIKVVLIKKAKWDFYTVLPIVIFLILMFIFNIISDINSLGNGTY